MESQQKHIFPNHASLYLFTYSTKYYMQTSNQLYKLMDTDIPSITQQKRLYYRTSLDEVNSLYDLLNREVFNDVLPKPNIIIMARCRKFWGYCLGDEYPDKGADRSYCTIKLSDKWYCRQWLITIIAHEMCHQYQWDVDSHTRKQLGLKPLLGHGPSFFIFKHELAKHRIPLKRSYGIRKWFKYQNLFKC